MKPNNLVRFSEPMDDEIGIIFKVVWADDPRTMIEDYSIDGKLVEIHGTQIVNIDDLEVVVPGTGRIA